MPNVVLRCISPGLRDILQAEGHHITDPGAKRVFEQLLAETPPCMDGGIIGLEVEETAGKAGRKKRAPSAYNLHVKECMARRPKDTPAPDHMKTCALEWRAKKGQR